jgi:hypothetical protein
MGVHTVEFRIATDLLFQKVDHEDLAKSLGVSVASIRQARLKESARAKRTPPNGWEKAVLKLAEERLAHYDQLVTELRLSERPHTVGESGRSQKERRPPSISVPSRERPL